MVGTSQASCLPDQSLWIYLLYLKREYIGYAFNRGRDYGKNYFKEK